MKPIIIFGNAQFAELAHYYFTTDGNRQIAAFTVDKDYIKENTFFNLPVISFETITEHFPPEKYDMFIAVGYQGVNKIRSEKYKQAKQKGYRFASYISTRSTVLCGDANIGDNCFILEGNVIHPFVKIGNNVTIFCGNCIGHHATIGNDCFITSHIIVGGNVIMEDQCFIGLNATLRNNIIIGKSSIIGACCWINKDVKPESLYTAIADKPREQKSYQQEKI